MLLKTWTSGESLRAADLNQGRRETGQVLSDWQRLVDRVTRLERILAATAGSRMFLAILGTSTSLGSNRWSYVFTQAMQMTTGHAGWKKMHADDALTGTCNNMLEVANSATQVNGTLIANLPSGFTFQPVAVDTLVVVTPQLLSDGTVEYWFLPIGNNVNGTC